MKGIVRTLAHSRSVKIEQSHLKVGVKNCNIRSHSLSPRNWFWLCTSRMYKFSCLVNYLVSKLACADLVCLPFDIIAFKVYPENQKEGSKVAAVSPNLGLSVFINILSLTLELSVPLPYKREVFYTYAKSPHN